MGQTISLPVDAAGTSSKRRAGSGLRSQQGGTPRSRASRVLPWLLPVGLLVLWQVSASLGILTTDILPSPDVVVASTWGVITDGSLLANLLISTQRALSGFVVGGLIGFGLGLANGVSRTSERLLDTTIQMLRTIPILALMPLIILWFGIGEESKVIMIAFAVFFPVYLNTWHGIRSIDPGLVEMGRVYGLNRRELFTQVIFPGALPSVLVGVRYALGIMWLVLIVAEMIAANSGIGYMAMQARELMQMDVVMISIVIYALLGKFSDVLARFLESVFLKWNPEFWKKNEKRRPA